MTPTLENHTPFESETKQDLSPRGNNFGFLRLLLASLVIVGHGPEIMDGDQHREIVHRLFGNETFGGLAVSGFFLISGFLIVKSWCSDSRLGPFLFRRSLRILPGYWIATLVSFALVLEFARIGPIYRSQQEMEALVDLVTLRGPQCIAPLRFLHHPVANGAMWTIRWEFACYLIVAAAGVLQIARRVEFWGLALVVGFATPFVLRWTGTSVPSDGLLGALPNFLLDFSVGALLYLGRDRIVYRRPYAIAAVGVMLLSLFFRDAFQAGVALFGGYALFAMAFAKIPRIGHIGTRNDVSYGLYLYAWPIQQLLFLYVPGISLTAHILASLTLAIGAGFLSWRFVESPCLKLKSLTLPKRSRQGTSAPSGTP